VLSVFAAIPVMANPLNVAWYVTDSGGNPLDGAGLTIYWSTSPDGPFTSMDPSIVEDKIAGVFQNPVVTGRWTSDHDQGIALADLRITSVSSYYLYSKITDGAQVWYWPVATSYKPGDLTWEPVAASGSPSGYAATGNGFGNGVTTAYPTDPFQEIPEFPTMAIPVAGVIGLLFFFNHRKRREK